VSFEDRPRHGYRPGIVHTGRIAVARGRNESPSVTQHLESVHVRQGATGHGGMGGGRLRLKEPPERNHAGCRLTGGVMAKVVQRDSDKLYAVAEEFVSRCLRADDSLFTPRERVWTAEHLAELRHRVVDDPDESEESFLLKLEGKLADAPVPVVQLAAELLFVHQLPMYEVRGDKKRSNVGAVLSLATGLLEIPPRLAESLDQGIVNYGIGKTKLWEQVSFFIRVVERLKDQPEEDRAQILDDPWRFKSFLYGLEPLGGQMQREALLHLVFPEFFEPVFSATDKKRIVAAFSDLVGDESDRDQAILKIRESLIAVHGEPLHFYEEPIIGFWKGSADTEATPAQQLLEAAWRAYQQDEQAFEQDVQRSAARGQANGRLRDVVEAFRSGHADIETFRQEFKDFARSTDKLWGWFSRLQFLNEFAQVADEEAVATLRASFQVPADLDQAVSNIESLAFTCERLVEENHGGGSSTTLAPGMAPYVISAGWAAEADERLPRMSKTALDVLAAFGLADRPNVAADRYRSFANGIADAASWLSVPNDRVMDALSWVNDHPFLGFVRADFDAAADNRRLIDEEFESGAGYTSVTASAEAESNIRWLIGQLRRLGGEIEDVLATALPAYPLKYCSEKSSWTATGRYRPEAWLYWGHEDAGESWNVAARVWLDETGVFVGLYVRNPSESAEATWLSSIGPQLSDLERSHGFAPYRALSHGQPLEPLREGEWLERAVAGAEGQLFFARRWPPGDAVEAGRGLMNEVVDTAERVAPLLEVFGQPAPGGPVQDEIWEIEFEGGRFELFVKLADLEDITARQTFEAFLEYTDREVETYFGTNIRIGKSRLAAIEQMLADGYHPKLCVAVPGQGLVGFAPVVGVTSTRERRSPPDANVRPPEYESDARHRTWLRIGRVLSADAMASPPTASDFVVDDDPSKRVSDLMFQRPAFSYIRYAPVRAERADEPLGLPSPERFEQGLEALRQELVIDREVVEQIVTNLVAGKSVILSGPTGTGKTRLAELIPRAFFNIDTHTVTATADWTSYEVIGGIFPALREDEDGSLVQTFTIRRGSVYEAILRNWQTDASGNLLRDDGAPVRKRMRQDDCTLEGTWLVIDEFNRADIDKAFGDIFTSIESKQLRVPAIRPDEPGEATELVPIPQHFRIIGTLNTFDRHYLFNMSDALKRRFAFVEVGLPRDDEAERQKVRERVERSLRHRNLEGPSSLIGDSLDRLYRFLGFVRRFRAVGVAQAMACLEYVAIRIALGEGNAVDYLEEAILSNVVPQLEALSTEELGYVAAWARGKPQDIIVRLEQGFTQAAGQPPRLGHLSIVAKVLADVGGDELAARSRQIAQMFEGSVLTDQVEAQLLALIEGPDRAEQPARSWASLATEFEVSPLPRVAAALEALAADRAF
jgi:MoxR-like ATPase